MSLESYIIYLCVSVITISSPGPGVIFSLNNAIRRGVVYAMPGIAGLSLGTLVVSAVAVSSIGTLIATHEYAFILLKYIGALYLVYLGVRLWKSAGQTGIEGHETQGVVKTKLDLFRQGMFITLLNPKLVVFFLALFPQFVNPNQVFLAQFVVLALTFSALLIVVHLLYCFSAYRAGRWFNSPKGQRTLNRTSGAAFFFFAIGLVLAK